MFTPQKKLIRILSVLCLAYLCSSTQTCLATQPRLKPAVFSNETPVSRTQSYSLDSRAHDNGEILDDALIGFWESRGERSVVVLEILSDHQLVIHDRRLNYRLIPGAMRITDQGLEFDYPYVIDGNELKLTVAEGPDHEPMTVIFQRISLSNAGMTRAVYSHSFVAQAHLG